MSSERLGSRYLLEERIGQGGLGIVWRGRDITDGTTYAVKLLRAEFAQDPDTLTRFVRERNALVRFRHPNVVTLHDMIVEGDRLALVMDFIAGGDLAGYRRRRGGTLPLGEAVELTVQICSALAACHAAGIVHRDLKPANVLLDGDLERRPQVRLTDFGIARIGGEAPVTTAGTVLGTIYYMAPEAIAGAKPAPACDVYAAGVTLYELLVGQPPFTGQAPTVIYGHLHTAPERPGAIPPGLWRLISACLAKDPAARPTAAQLAAALRRPGSLTPAPAARAAPFATPGIPQATDASVTSGMQASAPTGPADLEALQHTVTGIGWLTPAGPSTAPPDGATWPTPPAPPLGHLAARESATVSRSRRRLAWTGSVLAVLIVAGVAAFALKGSPGTSAPSAASRVAAALAASPTGSAADPSASGDQPSPGASASATGTTSNTSTAGTTAPSTASATPSAPTTAVPSSTGPANTAWQCGPTAAATLFSTGEDTGQTLQACIRVDDGKLELRGTLSPTVVSWNEQIILVLKDVNQQDHGRYISPTCTTADCSFDVTITPPSSGQWTVLPEWERFLGSNDFQSTGHEPGYVSV
jgi:serine/threonine protein kinase, bacterial